MKASEKQICRSIQGDLPLVGRPFHEIGSRMGTDEESTLRIIRALLDSGVIRKFGAIVRHQKIGYKKNAMIVWAIPASRAEEAGAALSSFKEVSHCYERMPLFMGKYNLFTMVHLKKENEKELLQRMVKATGANDFLVLSSEQEFKKSSMTYFE